LPREVFFGRLGLAGPFFSVSASDFGRFFPATSAPSADRVIATERLYLRIGVLDPERRKRSEV
jgi:hypothetical protein